MPRNTLPRDLTLTIAAKLAALTLLYFLCFSPPHRAAIDPAGHIAGLASPLPQQKP